MKIIHNGVIDYEAACRFFEIHTILDIEGIRLMPRSTEDVGRCVNWAFYLDFKSYEGRKNFITLSSYTGCRFDCSNIKRAAYNVLRFAWLPSAHKFVSLNEIKSVYDDAVKAFGIEQQKTETPENTYWEAANG